MREASAMSDLDHPNVIHLYGIVLATPIKLVMELAPLGSLHDRLRTEPQHFLVSTLYDFVLQVASGMSYLESKRYVHRDLAARNILLSSYDKVKIGDFGLMRQLPTEDDIYVMNPAGKVAVAWCAPECLKNREFSHASDVWAFGIAVIEIFAYGRQPWDGLSAVQILDIIDEPANGRPGKPDHCPDKLYSLLIEHCWDPSPKERSKFSCIKEKLQEAVPEEVTMFFDLKKDENPDNLVAKSGDVITVLTWKSRLGTEFAKGQNKITAEVGYFPSTQVTRSVLKRKGSARPRIAKVKDISPPLINSFSHCAHRGNSETPNWGTIMSEERWTVGKHQPLNLPTKLISLNTSDGNSQTHCEVSDVTDMDTYSLKSADRSNFSSCLSLGQRSWADSGYYSNRDTFMSQDYETMTGITGTSPPIAIPGTSPQGRQMIPPGTYNPATHYSRRPSGASLQFDPHVGSDGPPIVGSELRPALPAKQGVIGNYSNIRQMAKPYDNVNEIPESNYEDMQRLTPHVSPRGPLMSSSPESVYMNQLDMSNHEGLGYVNINYPIIYDRPSLDDRLDNCTKNGRCYSFPEFDMKTRFVMRGRKTNSFSSDKELPIPSILNESKSAPILDRDVGPIPNSQNWETGTPDEALSEEIYENIEIYNVPAAIMSEIPPPLPAKRRNSEKRISFHRNSGSHDLDIFKKLASSGELTEEHYSRPVSLADPSHFDAHLYAEISEKLLEELNLDDPNGDLEKSNEQCQDSFKEISKDYADLDAICAKLRDTIHPGENADEAKDGLAPCPAVESKTKPINKEDVLWKRFSTDQHRIQQHTRRPLRRTVSRDEHLPSILSDRGRRSSSSRSLSSNSLKHPCSDSVQSLNTIATLVTTV